MPSNQPNLLFIMADQYRHNPFDPPTVFADRYRKAPMPLPFTMI